MSLDEIDLELIKAKKRVKDLKKLKRQYKKTTRLLTQNYKPPVRCIVSDWIDSVCFCFENLVNR